MRHATSGTTLPIATHTWQVADQSLLANSSYAPAHFACPGARVNGGIVVASPRTALPATAGGADPNVVVWCDADNFLSIRISNNNANATAPTAADIIFDLMFLPLSP